MVLGSVCQIPHTERRGPPVLLPKLRKAFQQPHDPLPAPAMPRLGAIMRSRLNMKHRPLSALAACGVALALMTITLASVSESRQPVSRRQLLDQFQNTLVFWQQFEIAKRIVALHDPSVLLELVRWLNHEDRHLRGNAAFIFASLGDDRGFEGIRAILTDRSYRPASSRSMRSKTSGLKTHFPRCIVC
jgi:hypothetical protein